MKRRLCAILLAILMATVSMTGTTSAQDSGRQADTLDVDCSGYTFEDLFEYNNAIFMFEILDDWATSDLYANSWVNESRASVVRENLDSLFEGVPGGNNSWISTDERDAVRSIGAKCIADMYTRIGIREGIPHRGGSVDWNNASFVEDGIGLAEVDLIPEGHPDERDCDTSTDPFNYQSDDCREVPVEATNNLEISMFVKDGETHNTRFDQLANSGQSNFTVAMNVTNVTSATMMFTFPYVDGLRLADWTIQDDGDENLEPGNVEEIFLPDGSVRVSVSMSYDKADYPMIRNIFFDMTTTPPETNDIPEWTGSEPVDDTIIPMINDGSEVVAISSKIMQNWGTDSDAWGLDCQFAESGWSSTTNANGELLVTPGTSSSSDATCNLVDPYNAVSNASHTWRFGQPASFTASAGMYTDSVEIDATPSLLVQNLAVEISASQGSTIGAPTPANLGSTTSSNSVSLSGISPGSFIIHVSATSPGMLDWEAEFDLGLEKRNSKPIVGIIYDSIEGTHATWSSDLYSFTLTGTAIDPDGGSVTLSAEMCNEISTGFTQSGDSWSVTLSIASCTAQGITPFDVVITAKDSVEEPGFANVTIPDPWASEDSETESVDDTSEESSGLPSIGIFASIIAMLGAAILTRKD